MSYLKYYFSHDGLGLHFDSIACEENELPVEPDNFLKWYEDGDFVPQRFLDNKSESSFFTAIFAPRRVTFDFNDFLTVPKIK